MAIMAICCCMKAGLAAAAFSMWAGAAAGLIIGAGEMSGPPAAIRPRGEIAGNGCMGAGDTDGGMFCMSDADGGGWC